MHRNLRRFAAASLAMLAVVAAGCGSSSKSSSASTSTATTATSSAAAALVPAAVKSKGTLVVASDATYAPDEFIGPDGKTVQGMDADLINAVATKLGLTAKVGNVTFAAIIPGLSAHKYDIGISSMTDSKEREKTVDLVTYLSSGTSFYTKAQGGTAVGGLADLCGKTVAVETGTTQAIDVTAQSKKCKAAGKPGATLLVFPDQNGANLAISSGRAQIGMADGAVALYQVKKTGGQFKLTGTSYGVAPYGIAIAKDSGLAKAVQAALKALMADGTYAKILKTWGLSAGAIKTPVINGATS